MYGSCVRSCMLHVCKLRFYRPVYITPRGKMIANIFSLFLPRDDMRKHVLAMVRDRDIVATEY